MNDNEMGFHIYDDNDRDISSSSKKFEDISSSSRPSATEEYVDFCTFSDGKHYQKRRHGIMLWPHRVTEKWNSFNRGIRALLVSGIVVFTLVCLFLIWWFMPLGIRGKVFCSAFGLFVLNAGVYALIMWNKRIVQRVFAVIFAVILSAVMLLTTILWNPFLKTIYNYDSDFPSSPEALNALPTISKNITNIALFGLDTRDPKSFSGNSDSIMILSLNAKEHTVKIISIMRDSLVPIERGNKTVYSKINSAYAGTGGGPELAVKTLNQLFKLDITDYATVNFFGMTEMIDAVGGIDAELTEREVAPHGKYPLAPALNECIYEICVSMNVDPTKHYLHKSGVQHLNGIQAVAYSRIRYAANIWGTNNDFGRTDRQRYVMEQLFHKATTIPSSQYSKLINALIPYVKTSLNPDEILNYALNVLSGSPQFLQNRIPHSEYQMPSPSGSFGSVVYYDLDFASDLIHSFIYDDITFEDYIAQNGISKNDWYRQQFSGGSKPSSNPSTNQQTPATPPVSDEGDDSSSSGSSGSGDSQTPPTSDNPDNSSPDTPSSGKNDSGGGDENDGNGGNTDEEGSDNPPADET